MKRSKNLLILSLAGMLLVGANVVACNTNNTPAISYNISIDNKDDVELTVGDTKTYNVTISPSDSTVAWESSDTSVATVNNGVVSALKAGSATITATVGNVSDSVTITVKEAIVYSITIDKSVSTAYIGKGLDLSYTHSPEDVKVTWSTTDSNIAAVHNGTVTPLKEGKATITAKVGDASDSIEITVKNPLINGEVNTDVFDFNIYQDDASVSSKESLGTGVNSFAEFNGKAGKYYVASANVLMQKASDSDTWSRVGISHYNALDNSYYGTQVSAGVNFGAKKLVSMKIKDGNVDWGTVTDRSQIWNFHGMQSFDFTKAFKLTTVRNGSEYYSFVNDELFWVDHTFDYDDVDTIPVLNVGSAQATFTNLSVAYGEDSVKDIVASAASKVKFYPTYADTIINEDGSIEFKGASDSSCLSNAKDHAARSIGDAAVLPANKETVVDFDLKVNCFGGRDALPALAVTINRYDSNCAEARSLIIGQYKAGWRGWNSNVNLPDGIGDGGRAYSLNEEETRLEEGSTYHVTFTRLMSDAGQDTKLCIKDSDGNVLVEYAHGWSDGYKGRAVLNFLNRDLDCKITNLTIA